jgi:uncharacterized protein YndB with AHSA1/START domain
MDFSLPSAPITWRLHLRSSPAQVYQLLSTDEGRARFWAESAIETARAIDFIFPNGQAWKGRLIEQSPSRRYAVEYIGGSMARFDLDEDKAGGTLLTLTDENVKAEEWAEVAAGWVSVLMNLKAAVDYGIDLRNHDKSYVWEEGYVDN